MKRINRISILSLAAISMLMSCQNNTCPAPEVEEEEYTLDEYTFSPIHYSTKNEKLPAYDAEKPGQFVISYDIYRDIGENNYMRLKVTSDVNLVGHINYYDSEDPTVTNSEKFYIKANENVFTTFLDAFRNGAYGNFKKVITTIDFENVEEKEGNIIFEEAGVSPREQNIYKDMTITDDTLVFGTSMTHGGCIKTIKRVDQDIYEYLDNDGNVCIDRDIDPDYVNQVISDDVNFVNIYDLGREIQPSYYLNATKANGYDPQTELIYEGLSGVTLYNPIQCGSAGYKNPQIIDFVHKKDHIYIKTKAQDWFFDNDQANGYIETNYSFGGDGMLIVDNSYTDFSQFISNDENILLSRNQETPATYFVQPLNYFYCETRQGTIFDENVGEINGRQQDKTSKNQATNGEYVYSLKGNTVPGNWCAYVNQNKFGAGIYMPNADRFVGSRGRHSTNYFSEDTNRRFSEKSFHFDDSDYVPSYAVLNYNYICPVVVRKMVDFIPLKYSYAIYIGSTDEMGEAFGDLMASGKLTNESLVDGTGWPKK